MAVVGGLGTRTLLNRGYRKSMVKQDIKDLLALGVANKD